MLATLHDIMILRQSTAHWQSCFRVRPHLTMHFPAVISCTILPLLQQPKRCFSSPILTFVRKISTQSQNNLCTTNYQWSSFTVLQNADTV